MILGHRGKRMRGGSQSAGGFAWAEHLFSPEDEAGHFPAGEEPGAEHDFSRKATEHGPTRPESIGAILSERLSRGRDESVVTEESRMTS